MVRDKTKKVNQDQYLGNLLTPENNSEVFYMFNYKCYNGNILENIEYVSHIVGASLKHVLR